MGAQMFSGNVRIAYVDTAGALLKGYLPIFNAIKLALNTPEPDLKTQISHQNGSAGQALDEIAIPKPTEVESTFDDVADARVLAWSLNADTNAFSQVNTPIVDEVHTAQSGQWVQLSKRNVASFVLKDSTATTTYVNNTDYVVDTIAGFFMAIEGGAITDLSTVKASFTPATLSGTRLGVGAKPFQLLRIDGDMLSLNDAQTQVHVVVPCFKAYAAGALDFLDLSKLAVAALKGKALILPGQKAATVDVIPPS